MSVVKPSLSSTGHALKRSSGCAPTRPSRPGRAQEPRQHRLDDRFGSMKAGSLRCADGVVRSTRSTRSSIRSLRSCPAPRQPPPHTRLDEALGSGVPAPSARRSATPAAGHRSCAQDRRGGSLGGPRQLAPSTAWTMRGTGNQIGTLTVDQTYNDELRIKFVRTPCHAEEGRPKCDRSPRRRTRASNRGPSGAVPLVSRRSRMARPCPTPGASRSGNRGLPCGRLWSVRPSSTPLAFIHTGHIIPTDSATICAATCCCKRFARAPGRDVLDMQEVTGSSPVSPTTTRTSVERDEPREDRSPESRAAAGSPTIDLATAPPVSGRRTGPGVAR